MAFRLGEEAKEEEGKDERGGKSEMKAKRLFSHNFLIIPRARAIAEIAEDGRREKEKVKKKKNF